jgi:hypothetical protein
MRRFGLVGALTAGLALSGCGLSLGGAPSSTPSTRAIVTAPPTTTAGAPAVAQRNHELPTPAPAQTVPGGWHSPIQAVSVFAATYINWTAATVSVRLRALAEVSVGQARSAMSLAAAETAHDYELHRGGIANSGVVEAVAPVRDAANQYAVVTRERTTATNTSAYRGLQPAWHVSLATVTRVSGGLWVLSAWQPEG